MAKIKKIKDSMETVTVSGSNSTWVLGKGDSVKVEGPGIRDDNASNNVKVIINGDVLTLGDTDTTGVQGTGVGSTYVIGKSGSVTGDFGVALFGTDETLVNRGAINGDEIGFVFQGNNQVARNFGSITGVGSTAVQFNNGTGNHFINGVGGDVFGGDYAIFAPSTQSQPARVTNHGLIEGSVAAVIFEDGNDRFDNDGMVKGNVLLGIGHDESDLRGGKVIGYVYGDFGNDTYKVTNDVEIRELDGQGEDTVMAYRNYTLRADAHIETFKAMGKADLKLTGSNTVNEIVGNKGDNRLSGLAGDDTLDGGKGNDILTGGADNDFFVFLKGYGVDRITDFVTTGAQEDEIDLMGFNGIGTFSEVMEHAKNVGDNVVINFGGGDKIVIEGVQVENLEADNFYFL